MRKEVDARVQIPGAQELLFMKLFLLLYSLLPFPLSRHNEKKNVGC